ncbi:5314_t:CDS:2 [Diversispora eburnea]|uniref:5314_t:CDS:1 n=1 Tax=Diversispora eburnea TaxID=1213867 RepID=A0A9N9AIC1_9GLOM|nr:5314_t:CDS:2 [Diversispora eburnea]
MHNVVQQLSRNFGKIKSTIFQTKNNSILPKYNDASSTDSEDEILEKLTKGCSKNGGTNKNADVLERECSTRKLRDTTPVDYNHDLSETCFSDSDHESDRRKQSELDD